MSTSEMGGGPAGEESGRESAECSGQPVPPRWRPGGRRLAGRVVAVLAVEAAQAVVSAWAPEWSEATHFLTQAARAALRLRRGRDGRPRG
ncbi:hypothetical protein [Streptomyces sp. NBC_01443]|uniref:hypothetical protein n=1 Tax=Streptomyces sp. NBC_01443 TaxID=2903868 RepID=UPI00225984A2|nr:hypothetical protein [Streptomyces sp. NBC_01443]MCX4633179.1 hypothetical protein [Streptomyces sp. NBC_01443]